MKAANLLILRGFWKYTGEFLWIFKMCIIFRQRPVVIYPEWGPKSLLPPCSRR